MAKDEPAFIRKLKSKARKLQRALEQELDERIVLQECQLWIALVYGFKEFADLVHNYVDHRIVQDELLTESELNARLATQAGLLASDFEIDAAMARRVIEKVRPTAARFKLEGEGSEDAKW